MQDEPTSSRFPPLDLLLFSGIFFLFLISLVSPLYVATVTPTESSEEADSGMITTTWKIDVVTEQSEWSNATPFLGIENSTISSTSSSSTTPSVFEPSGDDVFHRMSRASKIQMLLLAVLSGTLIARSHRPVRSKTAQHGPTILVSAMIAFVGLWGMFGLVSDAGERVATVLEVEDIPSMDTDFFGGGIFKQEDSSIPFDVEITWRPSVWLLIPLSLIILSTLMLASEIRTLFKDSDHSSPHTFHTRIGDLGPTVLGSLAILFTIVALLAPWYGASTSNDDSSEFLQGTGNQSVTIGLWSASESTENEELVITTESLDRGPVSDLASLSERLDSQRWWIALIGISFIGGVVVSFLPSDGRPRALSSIFFLVGASLVLFIGVADIVDTDAGFSSLSGGDIAVLDSMVGDGDTRISSSSDLQHGVLTDSSGEEVAPGALSTHLESGRLLGAHAITPLLFLSMALLVTIILSSFFSGWENNDFNFDDWLIAQRGRVRAFGPLFAVLLIGASITSSLLIIERTQSNSGFFNEPSTTLTLTVTPMAIEYDDLVHETFEVTPMFVCDNGDRIDPSFVKDGSEDCGDASDEAEGAVEPEPVIIWSAPAGGKVAHDSEENDGSSLSDEILDGRLIRIGSFGLACLLLAFSAAQPRQLSDTGHRRRHFVGTIGWGLLTFTMLFLLLQHASIAEAFADDILAGFTGDARDAITNLERGRWGRFSSDTGLSYDWSPGSASLWALASFTICASITLSHLVEFTSRRTWNIVEVWSADPTLSPSTGEEDILPADGDSVNRITLVVGLLILLGVGAAVVGPWWSSSGVYLLPDDPLDDESRVPAGSTKAEVKTSLGLWSLRVDELPDNATSAQLLVDGEPVNTTRTQNGGDVGLLDTGRLITSMRAPTIVTFLLSIGIAILLFTRWKEINLPLGLQDISKFLLPMLAICLVATIEIGVTEFSTEIERTLRLDGRPEAGTEGISRTTPSIQVEGVQAAEANEEVSWGLSWGWSGMQIARLLSWVFATYTLTRWLLSSQDMASQISAMKRPTGMAFSAIAIGLTIIGAGMGNLFAVATGITEKVGSDDGLRTWDISLSFNDDNFLNENVEMNDGQTVQFSPDLSQSVPLTSDLRRVVIVMSCDEGAVAFGGGDEADSVDFTISPPPGLSDLLVSGPLTGTIECGAGSIQTEWHWPGVDDVPDTVESSSGEEAIAPYHFSSFEETWSVSITSTVRGDGIGVPIVQGQTEDDQLFANVEMNGESYTISSSRQTS